MSGRLLVICENANSLTEGYIFVQARSLKNIGWDVKFLCCEQQRDSLLSSDRDNVEFVSCAQLIKPKTKIERLNKIFRTYYYQNSELASCSEIAAWCDKIAQISPDVILVHFGTMAARILPALESFAGRWLVHFHGFDITERCKHWGYRRTLRHLMKVSPAVIGCSNFVVSRLEKYRPKGGCNIYVVSPGYDETRYRNLAQNKVMTPLEVTFISIARLDEVKGHDITLSALARLNIHTKLIIIGDGPEKCKLQNLSVHLGLVNRVKFLGAVSPSIILRQLRDADIFIQSSKSSKTGAIEGLGLSPLEASAVGLPIVVSNSGGLGETCINNETGFVFEENNVDELEAALNTLCIDSSLRKKMGEAGAKWVREKYSSESQGNKLNRVLMDAD